MPFTFYDILGLALGLIGVISIMQWLREVLTKFMMHPTHSQDESKHITETPNRAERGLCNGACQDSDLEKPSIAFESPVASPNAQFIMTTSEKTSAL
ncbi:hypothetical protein BC629DRAFT_1730006 [Irpex lacteus]|nr:hypothetical protein BC629DRAFT_1730006 [Irpex lacteus]